MKYLVAAFAAARRRGVAAGLWLLRACRRAGAYLWRRTCDSLFWASVESIHRVSALSAGWWSLLLASPCRMFALVPSWSILGRWHDQAWWAGVFLTMTLAHFVGILWPKPGYQLCVFVSSTATWGFMTWAAAASGAHVIVHIPLLGSVRLPYNTGIGPYGAFAVENLLGCIRASYSLAIDVAVAWHTGRRPVTPVTKNEGRRRRG